MPQNFLKTRVTELLGIKYPIVQGAMQWISKASLAAAVSNAGGLGIITATTQPDKKSLVEEIRKTRELTDKPFAVNISMLPKAGAADMTMTYLEAVIEEKVPVVETAGRSPEELIPHLKQAGIKIMHKVPAARFAKKAEQIGVDAVTVVGYEAGGHPGLDNVPTFIVLPKTVDSVSIPVLGAGGICDGRSFLAAFCLGAEGVVIGSRFMVTKEVEIHQNIKDWIVNAKETDTVLTQWSIRNPYRIMNNKTAARVLAMEKAGASLEELMPVISGKNGKKAMEEGDIDSAQITVGQAAGLIRDIKTVDQVIQDIVTEAESLLIKLAR